ncbi:MAG: hypothetical protein LBG92_05925, partial [Prevotellaceae bacterium]|nr:hypothetical protein [Prevotellaceae bacterium]
DMRMFLIVMPANDVYCRLNLIVYERWTESLNASFAANKTFAGKLTVSFAALNFINKLSRTYA